MDFRDLEYFSVVAEHHHVGRAAESLGLSQPALSLSLRRLQRSMQMQLVRRTPKGVELTLAGTALYARIRPLLSAKTNVTREIADLVGGRCGFVRVGVVAGVAEELAGVAGASFLSEAPTAVLSIQTMLVGALPDALRNGEIDMYITSVRGGPSADVVSENLLDDHYVVFAASRHPLARQERVALSDLVSCRWAVSVTTNRWERLSRIFEENNLPAPHFSLDSNSTAARLSAVANSDMLGVGTREFVLKVKRQYDLSILPVKEAFVAQRLAVCYRKNDYVPPAAKRFMEILKATSNQASRIG